MDRLFIYGSLQPGGANEKLLADVDGEWEPAVIRGDLIERGWGADIGYPGLVLNDWGDDIPGFVFSSSNLPSMWRVLDAFEGSDYERVTASVTCRSNRCGQVYVYVLRAG